MVLAVLERCSSLIIVSSVSATILPVSVWGGGIFIISRENIGRGGSSGSRSSKRDNGSWFSLFVFLFGLALFPPLTNIP